MNTPRTLTLALCKDPGFTPGRRDVAGLLALWEQTRGADSRDAARTVLKALARGDGGVATQLRRDFPQAPGAERAARLQALVRIAQRLGVDEVAPLLADALGDDEPRVVREAARAIGKLESLDGALYQDALLGVAEHAALPERRAAVDALGRVGDATALHALRRNHAASTEDADLQRRVEQAVVLLTRRVGRNEPSEVVATARLPASQTVWLRGRKGVAVTLEQQVRAELAPPGSEAERGLERSADGVRIPWAAELAPLFRARSALDVGLEFVLPPGPTLVERIVAGLHQTALVDALGAWTRGRPRFRMSFTSGGRKRAVLREVAQRLSQAHSPLRNDTREYTWTIEVDLQRSMLACFPRGADTRFTYREHDVAAATHPTFAALMAWAGRPREGEVVWDPFCGSGTELVECAMLAPGLHLRGTDQSAEAIEGARHNLGLASIEPASVELSCNNALSVDPRHEGTRVSLILSNPPMGRRVTVDGAGVRRLLHDFVAHAAHVLAPGGRVVWLSPAARTTALAADRNGLSVEDLDPIDMGGWFSTPQILRKPE